MAMDEDHAMTNDLFREYLDDMPPAHPPAEPIPLDEWQVQALLNILGSAAFQDFREKLVASGIITLPLPTEPRARALAAKQRRGHGPLPPGGWRGRERTTNYRSQ